MNLKNRIRKLETQNAAGEEFCKCRQNLRAEMYVQDLTEDSKDTEPRLTGEPLPDICPACGKAVKKDFLIIQLCDETTEKIENVEPSMEATFKIK